MGERKWESGADDLVWDEIDEAGQGEELVADRQSSELPRHTRFSSGVRMRVSLKPPRVPVDLDTTYSFTDLPAERIFKSGDAERIDQILAEYSDTDRTEERPTVPNLEVFMSWKGRVDDLTVQVVDDAEADIIGLEARTMMSDALGDVYSGEVLGIELENVLRVSDLPPRERLIYGIEKHVGYESAWWEMDHPLVRLWGQLDCAIQIVEDEQLLRDLVQVLGKTLVYKNGMSPAGFKDLIANAAYFRELIRAKYSEHVALLNAIIRKKDKIE